MRSNLEPSLLEGYVVAVIAQKQEMPKPGPEHQRLGAFLGNWTFEGELKPGPMGPGGKMTGTDRLEDLYILMGRVERSLGVRRPLRRSHRSVVRIRYLSYQHAETPYAPAL